MNHEKVIVPREVAEAIETVRKDDVSNFQIIHQTSGAMFTEPYLVLKRWSFGKQGGTVDDLMRALVNGYEVEKSPEENLREHYEDCMTNYLRTDGEIVKSYYDGKIYGIKAALNYLGITVEGIND